MTIHVLDCALKNNSIPSFACSIADLITLTFNIPHDYLAIFFTAMLCLLSLPCSPVSAWELFLSVEHWVRLMKLEHTSDHRFLKLLNRSVRPRSALKLSSSFLYLQLFKAIMYTGAVPLTLPRLSHRTCLATGTTVPHSYFFGAIWLSFFDC